MQLLRIPLILFMLICSVTYGVAQNCELSKNETDKFTKTKILHTKPIKITSEKLKQKKVYSIDKVEMQVKFDENSCLIYLSYYFAQGLSVATSNDKLILLLSDGETIDVPCIQNGPDQKISAYTSILSYHFKLSEEDFNKLTKTDISDIRMTAQINSIDFSINKDVKTSRIFDCVNRNK